MIMAHNEKNEWIIDKQEFTDILGVNFYDTARLLKNNAKIKKFGNKALLVTLVSRLGLLDPLGNEIEIEYHSSVRDKILYP